jgi:hypothetical protein
MKINFGRNTGQAANLSGVKRESVLPEAYALRRIPWQIFATLTFIKQSPFRCRRSKMRGWLREVADLSGTYFPRLLFFYRFETGKNGKHFHYHVALGGLVWRPIGFTKRCDCIWKEFGGGFTRIETYDPERDGVGYILKTSPDYGHSVCLCDDDTSIPTLSDSAFAVLASRDR